MSTTRTLRLVAVVAVAVAALVHPSAAIVGGLLAGLGYLGSALARRHEERRGERLDVAEWIGTHSFSCDTAAEVVAELRGTTMAELRSRVAARAFHEGRRHAADEAHERRSAVARRAAQTRAARCKAGRP